MIKGTNTSIFHSISHVRENMSISRQQTAASKPTSWTRERKEGSTYMQLNQQNITTKLSILVRKPPTRIKFIYWISLVTLVTAHPQTRSIIGRNSTHNFWSQLCNTQYKQKRKRRKNQKRGVIYLYPFYHVKQLTRVLNSQKGSDFIHLVVRATIKYQYSREVEYSSSGWSADRKLTIYSNPQYNLSIKHLSPHLQMHRR